MPFWKNLGKKPEDSSSRLSQQRFSEVARKYRNLKTTDSEPLSVIADKLNAFEHVEAVDVGCGAGRYDLLLFKHLGGRLNLTCLDANEEMLANLSEHLSKHRIGNFSAKQSRAETMPFPDNSMDCVFTFNAVHHFDLSRFLNESARVLKSGGYLFVYTRLREQNERNIWGQNFPGFTEKETKLYTLPDVKQAVEATDLLRIETAVFFSYNRLATLEFLKQRAENHHHSTFALYSPEELKQALAGFEVNIKNLFPDPQEVQWFDENVLFVIRVKEKASTEYLKIASAYRPPGTVM